MSITPSERTYNTLPQSYNEPEKLNIFQKSFILLEIF